MPKKDVHCRCATSFCDIYLTFDLDVVTLTFKICILETVRCRKLKLGRDIGWGRRCAKSCCDLGVTFGLGSAKMLSTVIDETYFFYHKDIWIAETDCYNYVLLPNCAITFGQLYLS